MTYYIGQIAGLLVTVGVFISYQMKNKQQMLLVNVAVNLLAALNILLLDGFGAAVVVNCIAVLQVFVSLWHDKKGDEPTIVEKIAFMIVYIVCSLLTFSGVLDILAIIAIVFYLVGVFQKSEQRIRLFLLGNNTSWLVYHAILGSTGALAQLVGITSALIGLYRYRNNKGDK